MGCGSIQIALIVPLLTRRQARRALAAREAQAEREGRRPGVEDRIPPRKTVIVLMSFPRKWWNVHSVAPPLYLLGWRFVYVRVCLLGCGMR